MYDLKISRYELIEVQVTLTAGGQVQFPSAISTLENNPQRKIFIHDMEIFPIYAQARSQKNNAVAGLPVADLPNFSVTIYYDDGNFIRNIPAPKLVYTVPPAGTAAPYQWSRVPFDALYPVAIDQCFLQYSAAPAGAYVVPIGIIYSAVNVLR